MFLLQARASMLAGVNKLADAVQVGWPRDTPLLLASACCLQLRTILA